MSITRTARAATLSCTLLILALGSLAAPRASQLGANDGFLLFVTDRDDPSELSMCPTCEDIYVMYPDGSEPIPLTDNDATDGNVDPRRLGVVALTNPRKEGDSLVTGTLAGAAAGTVRSGALESSGADAARSMVDMIASMRAFEAGQKVIQTIDETLGQAVTKVGAVGG